MRPVYVGLVHYPVRDREGGIITSAVTNLDVHDLARSARTYGLAGYLVVTPITAQRQIVDRILEHWRTGAGAKRTPERGVALSLCEAVTSVEQACAQIEAREGQPPRLVATGAKDYGRALTGFEDEARAIAASTRPTLLLFGTAHGLAPALVAKADVLLRPIRPDSDYNFLSVRAACAVVLDRLFSEG